MKKSGNLLTGQELVRRAGLSPNNATYYLLRADLTPAREDRIGNRIVQFFHERDVARLRAAIRRRRAR